MPRRIEVELTSSRDDGTWTWRAAGRPPAQGRARRRAAACRGQGRRRAAGRGRLRHRGHHRGGGRCRPSRPGASPSGSRSSGPARDEQLVTTTLVGKRGRGDDRRGGREGRDDRDGARADGDRDATAPSAAARAAPRASGAAPSREPGRAAERPPRRERPARPPRPEPEPRPKAKRLRAGRVHRNEVHGLAARGAEAHRRAGAARRHPRGAPGRRQAERAGQGVRRARDQGRRHGVDRRAAAPPPAHRRMARPGRRRAGRRRRGGAAPTCARWWWPPTSAARDEATRELAQQPPRRADPPGRAGARGLAGRDRRDAGRRSHGAGPAPQLAPAQGRRTPASRPVVPPGRGGQRRRSPPRRPRTATPPCSTRWPTPPCAAWSSPQGMPAEPGDALLGGGPQVGLPPAPDRHRLRDRDASAGAAPPPRRPKRVPAPRRAPTRARRPPSRWSSRAEPVAAASRRAGGRSVAGSRRRWSSREPEPAAGGRRSRPTTTGRA